jgi:broad specificity phosphatase PhoE
VFFPPVLRIVFYKQDEFMEKKIFFMRHGKALHNTDYEYLNYEEFMGFMLKINDERHGLTKEYKENFKVADKIKNVDIIYHSPFRRARETAELIQEKLHHKVEIENEPLLAEIAFSENIITEAEFLKFGGLKGCRSLILKRWHDNENSETFSDSKKRLLELDKKLNSTPRQNILLITHGWYLRLIVPYYQQGKQNITLEDLLNAHRYDYGQFFEYDLKPELYPGERHDAISNSEKKFVPAFQFAPGLA